MQAVVCAALVHKLPLVNAALNAAAAVLLAAGYALIRRRREAAHKALMLSAFCVSVLFLASYVVYHVRTEAVRSFAGPGGLRPVYYAMLASHVVLAACVPFLALRTIYLGLRDRRAAHRRLARWTLPVWLYVSITGVLVYLALYVLWPARE
jgi:uncharacterized membrane protein YozB (DUF420 family)